MRRTLLLAALILSVAAPARAGEGVGANYENLAQIEGTVVDVLCELTGSCPADCGGGTRLLGIKAADGAITPIVKGAPIFANATPSALPYCGKTIYADGLFIENPKMRVYYIQKTRANPGDPWTDDEGFSKEWAARYGQAEEWFRADPTVKATIGDKGVLGIKGLAPKPQ